MRPACPPQQRLRGSAVRSCAALCLLLAALYGLATVPVQEAPTDLAFRGSIGLRGISAPPLTSLTAKRRQIVPKAVEQVAPPPVADPPGLFPAELPVEPG